MATIHLNDQSTDEDVRQAVNRIVYRDRGISDYGDQIKVRKSDLDDWLLDIDNDQANHKHASFGSILTVTDFQVAVATGVPSVFGGNTTINAPVAINSTLHVTQAVTLDQALSVAGATTMTGLTAAATQVTTLRVTAPGTTIIDGTTVHNDTTTQNGLLQIQSASTEFGLSIAYDQAAGRRWIGATNAADPDMTFHDASGDEVVRFGVSGGAEQLTVTGVSAATSFKVDGTTKVIEWAHSGVTQTTVGAAGGASALPGAPKGYWKGVDHTGASIVTPYWAAS